MTFRNKIAHALVALHALTCCLGASGFLSVDQIHFIQDGDERYATFRSLARYYDMKSRGHWHGKVKLSRGELDLEFEKGSRKALFDGQLVWLNLPSYQVGHRWGLSEVDVKSILHPYLVPDDILRKVGHAVVVLDPGHGGEDTGGTGPARLNEKDVVLEISQRVKRYLVEEAGLTVYMTRDQDNTLSLKQRSVFARKKAADVFVSIHANAAGNTAAAGVETYILPPPGYSSTSTRHEHKPEIKVYGGNTFDGANFLLGTYLQKKLVQSYDDAVDRGVRQARYVVLRDAPCPAALVECGFISNPEEEALMKTEEYLGGMSKGIAIGILNYIGRVKQAHLTLEPEAP